MKTNVGEILLQKDKINLVMKSLNLSCYNVKNENRTKFERFILKLANSCARANGRGKATYIEINEKGNETIKYLNGRSWHYTTQSGIHVRYPNAYRRKAKSANLIYNSAFCDIEVNPKLIAIQYFGEI